MEKDYLCPVCMGNLNVHDEVIMSTKNSKNEVGLVMLSPEVGNYTVKKNPAYRIVDGEILDFKCSICNSDLTAHALCENMAMVKLLEKGREFDVFFSRIAGEKCTYKVLEGKVESFGECMKKYDKFLSLVRKQN